MKDTWSWIILIENASIPKHSANLKANNAHSITNTLLTALFNTLGFFLNIARSTGRHVRTHVGHPRWPRAQRRWAAGKSEDTPTGDHTRARTHTYTHAHTLPGTPLGKIPGATPERSQTGNRTRAGGLHGGRAHHCATGALAHPRLYAACFMHILLAAAVSSLDT